MALKMLSAIICLALFSFDQSYANINASVEFKFMVLLKILPDVIQTEEKLCPGMIIDTRHIVASARCTKRDYVYGPETMIIFPNFETDKKSTSALRVTWKKHRYFDDYHLDNDIAVMELRDMVIDLRDTRLGTVELSLINPEGKSARSSLKKCKVIYLDSPATTEEKEIPKPTIKYVDIDVNFPKATCAKSVSQYGGICAKPKTVSNNICSVGNPLICSTNNKNMLVGLYNNKGPCENGQAQFFKIYALRDFLTAAMVLDDSANELANTKFQGRMMGGNAVIKPSFLTFTFILLVLLLKTTYFERFLSY